MNHHLDIAREEDEEEGGGVGGYGSSDGDGGSGSDGESGATTGPALRGRIDELERSVARLTALLEGQVLLGREPSPSTSPSPPSTGEGASPPPPETPRRIGSNVLPLDSPSPGPRGSSASDAAFSGYDDALGPSDDPPPSAVPLPPRPQPAPEIEYRSYSQGQVDALRAKGGGGGGEGSSSSRARSSDAPSEPWEGRLGGGSGGGGGGGALAAGMGFIGGLKGGKLPFFSPLVAEAREMSPPSGRPGAEAGSSPALAPSPGPGPTSPLSPSSPVRLPPFAAIAEGREMDSAASRSASSLPPLPPLDCAGDQVRRRESDADDSFATASAVEALPKSGSSSSLPSVVAGKPRSASVASSTEGGGGAAGPPPSKRKSSKSASSSKGRPSSSSAKATPAGKGKSSHRASSSGGATGKGADQTAANELRSPAKTSLMAYLKKEMMIDSTRQEGSFTDDVDANMEEFLRVPRRLELLQSFGFWICTDAFLYVLTFLPIKFVWSLICLVATIVRPGKGMGICRFHRRHLYQLLQMGVCVFSYFFVLKPISMGVLYHYIRGQAMLKLYVLIAIVEVFDRLLCSLGQDALDSLYWNVTKRPYHYRVIKSFVVVLVYVILHSLLLLLHCATLNVAMNSSDHALLTLIISGNFAEIKSTVFKKYNKQNLFKITTSDICERFKLAVFLSSIFFLNCFQGGMNIAKIWDYLHVCGVVLVSEVFSDWIKHSFITKFNFIKSSAYTDYTLIMAGDLTGIGHEGVNLNHTHAVVKRLGFSQIPVVCVTLRFLNEAMRYAVMFSHGDTFYSFNKFAFLYTEGRLAILTGYVIGAFFLTLMIKIFLGYILLSISRKMLEVPSHSENSSPAKSKSKAAKVKTT